ncbi:protein MAIN-LIKE 2-like [Phaseolus vulgaris]|uniref:protein MAIN-LIKE 2-like n=1 Tax=Phaseolus vulgaris TaxID=3885 RepID=UPI0035CB2A86
MAKTRGGGYQELHDGGQVDQGEGFPGGPSDMSLLVNFADHVVVKLWDGEDRGELKLVSHGRKLRKFGMPHVEIAVLIQNSGLFSLCNISYEVGDRGLISAFVERWHAETNSFHLSIGEMTITLDDVSSLLHFPILGQFPTYVPLEYNGAATILTELLEVEEAHGKAEMRQCRGVHVRLNWLRDIYAECCAQEAWECAARAYLLHVVGCTIFADKSAISVSVSYLLLFNNLRMCGGYAWGAAALTHLYEQLRDASYFNTKQLSSYVTLVQAWIYEHFSGMGRRDINPSYDEVTYDWAAYHRDICPSVCCANLATSRAFHHHRCQLRVLVHMTVSHPYIRRGELGDRPNVVPHRHLRSPNAEQASLSSQDEHAHSVTEGTDAYESTEAALHLARSVTDDGAVYTRRSRNVRGRH